MALVTFEDYPSTDTPLNATNLNNNFSELLTLATNNNPVAIEDSSITVNLTGVSLNQNHSFTIGGTTKAVFLNIKFAGVNLTPSDGNVTLATLSNYLRPSSETVIVAQANGNNVVYGWLRSNGEIAFRTTSELIDADIRIVTMYI